MKKTAFLIVTLLLVPLLSAYADSVRGSPETFDTLVLVQPCTEFGGCIPAGSTVVDPAGVLIVQEFFTPCLFSSASTCVLPPNCPNSSKQGCNDNGAEPFIIDFIVQSDGTLTGFGLGRCQ